MIRRKTMNNKDQENGARTGPLIFTVPAYGFVMALYLDWLGGSHLAFPPNPFARGVEPVEPARFKQAKRAS
jgi:hypothetical protein